MLRFFCYERSHSLARLLPFDFIFLLYPLIALTAVTPALMALRRCAFIQRGGTKFLLKVLLVKRGTCLIGNGNQ